MKHVSPYFKEGEEVTIVSEQRPDLNGDGFIEEGPLAAGDTIESLSTTHRRHYRAPHQQKFGYIVNGRLFSQCVLRKKYKPGHSNYGEYATKSEITNEG